MLLKTFAFTCGVHERDLGVALFHANEGPFSAAPVKGAVVFDGTNGSLRLTERLAREFADVVKAATDQCQSGSELHKHLRSLHDLVAALQPAARAAASQPPPGEGEWIHVIERKQSAMYLSGEAPAEVTVLDFRYTPHGLMYQLEPLKGAGYSVRPDTGRVRGDTTIVPNQPAKWMVLASVVQPLAGVTRMIRYNVVTGVEGPIEDGRSESERN
jgi:hypothetical protein